MGVKLSVTSDAFLSPRKSAVLGCNVSAGVCVLQDNSHTIKTDLDCGNVCRNSPALIRHIDFKALSKIQSELIR